MSQFALRDMILAGWPVLTVLLIMSVISFTVILDRWTTIRRTRLNVPLFTKNVIRLLKEQGQTEALEYCQRYNKPVADVCAKILLKSGNRAAKERVAQYALQYHIGRLGAYVPILGTIGSTAPFIGLFGTVTGIIRAFQDIAMHADMGPQVVSAGVGEALITTAFGLLIAIPAVMSYNYCARKIELMTQEIDMAAYEIIEETTQED